MKQEAKRLRRAEKRLERRCPERLSLDPERQGDQATCLDESLEREHLRRHLRQERKSGQRKAREMTISRFRQIVLSDDGSGDEETVEGESAALKQREEPRIPSSVGKSLRKKVNRLTQLFDASLSLDQEHLSRQQ